MDLECLKFYFVLKLDNYLKRSCFKMYEVKLDVSYT